MLFLVGRTRIHLDQVEDLASFIELEVVLEENGNFDKGVNEASYLMEKLAIKTSNLIEDAYIDLMHRMTD